MTITKSVRLVSFPNPYVSDGLTAMWDGEWNAGWGVHDPSAAKWINLAGNPSNDLTPIGGCTFENNHVIFGKEQYVNHALSLERRYTPDIPFTVECVLAKRTVGTALNVGYYNFGGSYHGNFAMSGDTDAEYAQVCGTNVAYPELHDYNTIHSVVGAYDGNNTCSTFINGSKKPDTQPGAKTTLDKMQLLINSAYGQSSGYTRHIYCLRLYIGKRLPDVDILKNYAVDKARFGLA